MLILISSHCLADCLPTEITEVRIWDYGRNFVKLSMSMWAIAQNPVDQLESFIVRYSGLPTTPIFTRNDWLFFGVLDLCSVKSSRFGIFRHDMAALTRAWTLFLSPPDGPCYIFLFLRRIVIGWLVVYNSKYVSSRLFLLFTQALILLHLDEYNFHPAK